MPLPTCSKPPLSPTSRRICVGSGHLPDEPELTFCYGLGSHQLERMRTGASYTHLIRAPGDPERRPRGRQHPLGYAPHHKLAQLSHNRLRRLLMELFDATLGSARTFHTVSVLLFDVGADVTFDGPLDAALWSLVSDGYLAMTLGAPVRFVSSRALRGCGQLPAFEPVPDVQGDLFG